MIVTITACSKIQIENNSGAAITPRIYKLTKEGTYEVAYTLPSIAANATGQSLSLVDNMYAVTLSSGAITIDGDVFTPSDVILIPVLCTINACEVALVNSLFCETDDCEKSVTVFSIRKHLKFRDAHTMLGFQIKNILENQPYTKFVQPPLPYFMTMFQLFDALTSMCKTICGASPAIVNCNTCK